MKLHVQTLFAALLIFASGCASVPLSQRAPASGYGASVCASLFSQTPTESEQSGGWSSSRFEKAQSELAKDPTAIPAKEWATRSPEEVLAALEAKSRTEHIDPFDFSDFLDRANPKELKSLGKFVARLQSSDGLPSSEIKRNIFVIYELTHRKSSYFYQFKALFSSAGRRAEIEAAETRRLESQWAVESVEGAFQKAGLLRDSTWVEKFRVWRGQGRTAAGWAFTALLTLPSILAGHVTAFAPMVKEPLPSRTIAEAAADLARAGLHADTPALNLVRREYKRQFYWNWVARVVSLYYLIDFSQFISLEIQHRLEARHAAKEQAKAMVTMVDGMKEAAERTAVPVAERLAQEFQATLQQMGGQKLDPSDPIFKQIEEATRRVREQQEGPG